jgi:hypothetical protein
LKRKPSRPNAERSLKKKKNEWDEVDESNRTSFVWKVITCVNRVLIMADIDKRVDHTYVQIFKDGEFKKAIVKCPICSDPLKLSMTRYSVSNGNFRRHLLLRHNLLDIKKERSSM